MKKVLLIGDSPVSMSPYIQAYINIFEDNNIPYELVFWNKTLENVANLPETFIPYNKAHDICSSGWKKVLMISGFVQFAKRRMNSNEYAYVVVFTIAHAIFLYSYLAKHFKGRYVFDIRDHSPLCKSSFCNFIVKKLIENSALTVLSSRGFLRWLPATENDKIVIVHNSLFYRADVNSVEIANRKNNEINILTIGQISYLDSQLFFIKQLGNVGDFSLEYAGSGPAVPKLLEYVQNNGIQNIYFSGRYEKKDEPEIVKKSDMINIWLKSDINADSCMANRFYLSAAFRKPMIVHKGSYMAELCEEYKLGVVLEDKDSFSKELMHWWKSFDYKVYNDNCIRFLKTVTSEMELFETKLKTFYKTCD